MRPRIGLLGGSFDPPHLGHLALGRMALAAAGLDELRWLPAGAPWQKAPSALAPAHHRLAMLHLLLNGQPQSTVDARELHRAGPTYSVDTLRELQAEMPHADWFLVIGQDQYARLDTWQAWRELLAGVTLLVAQRDGRAVQPNATVAAQAHRLQSLPELHCAVSATQVRQCLAQGQGVQALVGAGVASYIDQHRLYQSNRS